MRHLSSLLGMAFLCSFSASAFDSPPDPVGQLSKEFTSEDAAECRKLFEQLRNGDFDAREQALGRLVSKGIAVLTITGEFVNDKDPEVAAQARGLKDRLLFKYDGYLQTDSALVRALKTTVTVLPISAETPLKLALAHITDEVKIEFVYDAKIKDARFNDDFSVAPGLKCTALEAMTMYAGATGLRCVPRGKVCVVTTDEAAKELESQRYTFDWSGLALTRDEAERVGKALQNYYPPVNTEIHTGSEVLTIRGSEEAVKRTTRLLALLKPGAPDALWPAPDGNAVDPAMIKKLETPCSLLLGSADPLDIVPQLKKQHLDVFVVTHAGEVLQDPPFPDELRGFAPARLNLHNVPLGAALHWVERRAKVAAADQAQMALVYMLGPSGRIELSLQPKGVNVLNYSLGGADVTFLYPRNAKPGPESDADARKLLLDSLRPQLECFPAQTLGRDLTVIRGRLLVQGPAQTLLHILELVEQWRATRQPPKPPNWKIDLESSLAAHVDWDGRGLSGGKLLARLRALGKVDILIEDAPDGSAADFNITPEDAQLLPPGNYEIKELLSDLAKRTGAEWKIEYGAIVLMPKPALNK